jgi:phosphatidylglycerophosphate synthase
MDNDYARILAAYPPEKKAWDKTYPWIYYVLRPLSFPVSYFFRKIGWSADAVTGLTAVLGLAALPGLALGGGLAAVGALCLLLYNFLDCVDGNLARAWPRPGPPVGKFWDQMVGNSYWLAYAFLGLGTGDVFFVILGGAVTIEKYAVQAARHMFWSVLGPEWEKVKAVPGSDFTPHAGRWYYKLYYNLTDLQAHVPLLALCAALDAADLFLSISFLFALLELAATIGLYLRRSFELRERS